MWIDTNHYSTDVFKTVMYFTAADEAAQIAEGLPEPAGKNGE